MNGFRRFISICEDNLFYFATFQHQNRFQYRFETAQGQLNSKITIKRIFQTLIQMIVDLIWWNEKRTHRTL